MSWSTEQQRLLSAMGYTLYRQAPAPTSASSPPGLVQDVQVDYPAATSATAGRLLQALQRAAAGRDVAGLVGDLEVLRRDPMKKRALWPRLRALRRAH